MSELEEKSLLRRVVEICATLETGKWNGYASTDMIEDEEHDIAKATKISSILKRTTSSCSSSGCSTPLLTISNTANARRGIRKKPSINKASTTPKPITTTLTLTNLNKADKQGACGTANITNIASLDLIELEKEKMRNLMHQSFCNSLQKVKKHLFCKK